MVNTTLADDLIGHLCKVPNGSVAIKRHEWNGFENKARERGLTLKIKFENMYQREYGLKKDRRCKV